MRALLRDADDNTLILIAVEHISYDREKQELYISSENFDYTISGIIQVNAEAIIHDLFETGHTDFTQYSAKNDN